GSAATWSDLARRPQESRIRPDWTQGVVVLAGLFPMYVLLSGVPARMASWTVLGRLGANAVVLCVLFVCWPGLIAWMRRIEWRGAFRMFMPTALAILGAACLGMSLWPFIYEIVRLVSSERLTDLAEQFRALEGEIRAVPLEWKLLTLAVIPAVCEELFFRGFLFQSLQSALGSLTTVGITAALFGLFHIAVG